jgi:hypothetical protein
MHCPTVCIIPIVGAAGGWPKDGGAMRYAKLHSMHGGSEGGGGGVEGLLVDEQLMRLLWAARAWWR